MAKHRNGGSLPKFSHRAISPALLASSGTRTYRKETIDA
jgi:hypothetical protein